MAAKAFAEMLTAMQQVGFVQVLPGLYCRASVSA